MEYNKNKEVVEYIKWIVEEGAIIKDSEVINQNGNIFVRVYYTVSEEYQKENNLWYRNRYLEYLIVPNEIFEGQFVTSAADTRDIK